MHSTERNINNLLFSAYNVILGDFNVNWFDQSHRHPLSNVLITDYQYRPLISQATTDYRTCIDHIYTNAPNESVASYVKESYFSDHKSIGVILSV